MNTSHEYNRDLTQAIGPEDSLGRLFSWIPWGAKVLELGPARGYFTRQMATMRNCTVDAVELDEHMAELARPFCRKLIVGDLSSLKLGEHFSAGSYQIIVLADVIEHLVNPERLLEELIPLLTPGGQILLSVPNVAYAGLVAALLAGQFEYRDEGLLDRTHLRFFTRDSLGQLLSGSGLFPLEWVQVFRPLNESEFKIRVESLTTAVREALLSSPHALCYQWLVRVSSQPQIEQLSESGPCWQDAFPLRVYSSSVVDPAHTATVSVAWAKVGVERQTLKLEIPALERSEINIVLADRIGYLRLYSVKLYNTQNLIWSWSHGDELSTLAIHFHRLALANADQCALVTLLDGASWIQLNTNEVSFPSAATLEIELGWPMSSDYMAAKAGWETHLSSAKP